jgi:hypothetical protein
VFQFCLRDDVGHFSAPVILAATIAAFMRQTGQRVRIDALDGTQWRSPSGLASVKDEPMQDANEKDV